MTTPKPTSLYDMLDIDQTAGIDQTEVEKIKLVLERIKIYSADVAKNNDTEETLQILNFVLKFVKEISSMAPAEVVALMNRFFAGQTKQALSSGNPRQSGDEDRDLQGRLTAAETANDDLKQNQKNLLEAVKAATDADVNLVNGTIVPASVTSDVRKAIKDKVDKARADATPTDSVDKVKVVDALKTIEDATGTIKTSAFSNRVDTTKLVAAINDAKKLVS